jgi:ABC-type transporter Mla subunit MlaD
MLERLSRQLGKKDFSEHVESIHRLLAQLGYFVESGGSSKLLKDISDIAGNLNSLTASLEQEVPALVREGRDTLKLVEAQVVKLSEAAEVAVRDMRDTAESSRKLMAGVMAVLEENRPDMRSIVSGLNAATSSAQKSLAQSEQLLKTLNEMTAPDSEMRSRLESTLEECQESAVRLRIFLDLISRNPQMLLLGE